jgi:hypothetical protein
MATEKQFTKGLYPTKITTKFGEMQKIGIHKEQFMAWLQAQKPNEKGYVSVIIGNGKEGKQYGYLDTYVPQQTNAFQKSNEVITPEVIPNEQQNDGLPF